MTPIVLHSGDLRPSVGTVSETSLERCTQRVNRLINDRVNDQDVLATHHVIVQDIQITPTYCDSYMGMVVFTYQKKKE